MRRREPLLIGGVSSALVRAVIGAATLLAIGLVLFPVLSYPIRADDAYWLLAEPPQAGSSILRAYADALAGAYAFDGQPRTTALASAERIAIQIVVMEFATEFAVPPMVPWAMTKVLWLGVAAGALWVFLSRIQVRASSGAIENLDRRSRLILLAGVPAVALTMVELETVGLTNGWIFYPNLTYLPFAVYLLVAVIALEAESLLRRRFRIWLAPVVGALIGIAWIVSLSYELLALSIPFAIGMLVLKPLDEPGNFWRRNRMKFVVGGALGGTYLILFAWTRWRISQMQCQIDDTCYSGTVVQFDPVTVVHNLMAGLPGSGFDWIVSGESGPVPLARLFGAVVLVAVVVLGALAWLTVARTPRAVGAPTTSSASRILLQLAAVMVAIALGSIVITGITARAVERLVEPVSPYRSGVIVALALSVAVVAIAVVIWRSLSARPALRRALLAIGVTSVISLGSTNLLMNLALKPAALGSANSVALDRIHAEVALGNTQPWADSFRCDLLEQYWASWANPGETARKVVAGADLGFRHYHQQPFCSTGLPGDD